ncbi:MAG: hypothetical protein JJT89_14010 [Nitriliruptoraceae bacterium]|nr:hypothetical protein [Nitriliruptoraceae bacterium]
MNGRAPTAHHQPGDPSPSRRDRTRTRWLLIAGIAHLAVLVPFTIATGLMVPGAGIVVLLAVWVAAGFAGLRLSAVRPALALVAPVVAAAILAATVSVGPTLFGWTP